MFIPYGPYSTPYLLFFFVFLAADIGVFIYYANTRCFKGPYRVSGKSGVTDDEYLKKSGSTAGKHKPAALIAGICIAVLPVILLVSITLYTSSRPPVFTVSGGELKISAAYGQTIRLADIKSIRLEDALPQHLKKISGSDFGFILRGRFSADGKEAELCLDAAKPPFLYIETADGLTILNDRSKAETEKLYEEIKAAKP